VGLTVSDSGVGIPDDVLPRVFEPFFTTKEAGKGSGLGLAQVFGFAKQSGGGVRINTRVGEGTSVQVFLPRAEIAVGDHERKLVDAEQGLHRKRGTRVLVVDDDNSVLKSTLRLLSFLGYASVPAKSGREALRLIANEQGIDLVLVDLAMPEMNGVDLTKAIHGMRPALPVILVSGYGDLDVLREFGEARILQKPYTGASLVDKITAALS
jgi:CheY-like chemotaxis protein